jgi:NosR/NirI family nitrous oxide reductase transcriptional regulator
LLITVFLTLSLGARTAQSAELERFLRDVQPGDIFPGANRLAAPQGSPPVAAAFSGDKQLGFVFLNSDIVNATGYSGKPIHVLIAMDMDAVRAYRPHRYSGKAHQRVYRRLRGTRRGEAR